jgi:hypothetical protein
MNKKDSLNNAVEDVESVENFVFTRDINKKYDQQSSTQLQSTCVEIVGEIQLLSYFSTLSTKLKRSYVEDEHPLKSLNINNLSYIPQFPQIPHYQNGQLSSVFDWLQIVLDEGHIEPSQPCIGRLLGWPTRSFSTRSLWIDFDLFCRKKEIPPAHIADSLLFFSLLSEIFNRIDERYEFPPLLICREKFLNLRRNYESIAIAQ